MRTVTATVLAAILLTGCSEPLDDSSGDHDPQPDGAIEAKDSADGSIVGSFAGSPWSYGEVPDSATAADGEPIVVGMLSVDSGPIGALPELHAGAEAAVEFVNSELNGVDGRPLQLEFCNVDLTAERSEACARDIVEKGAVAAVGGINVMSAPALRVLEKAKVPLVGGVPVNTDEMTSEWAFLFSGGTPGATVAFADDIIRRVKADKVAVIQTDIPAIVDAARPGIEVLEAAGVDVVTVPFAMTTQDFASVAQKANESSPDAIVLVAADAACASVPRALDDIGSAATLYAVGSCADRKYLDQNDPEVTKGMVFSIENRIDQTARTADYEVYTAAIERFAEGTNPAGAATVTFRGVMNLWWALGEIDGDITGESIAERFRQSADVNNFDGHAFTCDGKQFPGFRAFCSPQQVLVTYRGTGDPTDLDELSGEWVDVGAVYADATGG